MSRRQVKKKNEKNKTAPQYVRVMGEHSTLGGGLIQQPYDFLNLFIRLCPSLQ